MPCPFSGLWMVSVTSSSAPMRMKAFGVSAVLPGGPNCAASSPVSEKPSTRPPPAPAEILIKLRRFMPVTPPSGDRILPPYHLKADLEVRLHMHEGVMRTRITVVVLLGLASPAMAQTPTFYKDVLPILQANCQTCHRPGEVAPMSLLTYEDARPWARAIKTAIATKKMPPWFADPAVGHFSNERRLSPRDAETITAWVDAG